MNLYYRRRANFYGNAALNWLIYLLTAFVVGVTLFYCIIQVLEMAAQIIKN